MESTKWYASAYKSVIAINATMDHDTPPNQFVVAINVPQGVWARNTIFSTLDCCMQTKNMAKRVDTF